MGSDCGESLGDGNFEGFQQVGFGPQWGLAGLSADCDIPTYGKRVIISIS
jgi:hypothetical protein